MTTMGNWKFSDDIDNILSQVRSHIISFAMEVATRGEVSEPPNDLELFVLREMSKQTPSDSSTYDLLKRIEQETGCCIFEKEPSPAELDGLVYRRMASPRADGRVDTVIRAADGTHVGRVFAPDEDFKHVAVFFLRSPGKFSAPSEGQALEMTGHELGKFNDYEKAVSVITDEWYKLDSKLYFEGRAAGFIPTEAEVVVVGEGQSPSNPCSKCERDPHTPSGSCEPYCFAEFSDPLFQRHLTEKPNGSNETR